MLTQENCNEIYKIVRNSIRSATIYSKPELWKRLRNFEPDPEISIPSNRNLFISKHYPTFETEAGSDREKIKKKYNLDIDKLVGLDLGRFSFPSIEEIIELNSLMIDFYTYLKISRILYIEDLNELFLGGAENYRKFFDAEIADLNSTGDNDYIYDIEEELLNETSKYRNLKYVNEPFMVIGFNSGFITCVAMEHIGHFIQYSMFSIGKNNGKIYDAITWFQDLNYEMTFEHIDMNNDEQVIASGGITIFNYFSRTSLILRTKNEDFYNFNIINIDKGSYKKKLKDCTTQEMYNATVKLVKGQSIAMLNYALAARRGLDMYIERTPEIKEVFDKIDRMTPSSKENLEKDHPSIANLDYTKYEYLNEDYTPMKRESKGGTHASPGEHERSGCMRYNPKTGKKDIPVRGCTVNKGKPKVQYYKRLNN